MQTNNQMIVHRKDAKVTGVLYISAAVAAIVAVLLYQPLLSNGKAGIVCAMAGNGVILGAIFDLITVCSVAGTAIVLFPYIRTYNRNLGLAYLCFRWFEAISILVGLIGILSAFSLQRAYPLDSEYITPHLSMLTGLHDWTMIIGPNFLLGINTFIYSMVFYRSQLVPRRLAILGMFSALLIFTAAILAMFQVVQQTSVTGALLALPIFTFEMALATRLLSKGFNEKSFLLEPRNFCQEELFGIGA